jgi:hypothetical protein
MATSGHQGRRVFSRFVICVGMICWLAGCGGPAFKDEQAAIQNVPPGKARIVIFRPWRYVGALVSSDIKVDGKVIGRLGNGSFSTVDHDPGGPEIILPNGFLMKDFQYSFSVEAGKIYYLEVWAYNSSGFGGPGQVAVDSLFVPGQSTASYCGPQWCVRREDAAEALPKLSSLSRG